jgi:hypothetical protein
MNDPVITLIQENWEKLIKRYGNKVYNMRIEDVYYLIRPKPTILYSAEAEAKIKGLVQASGIEISWHGLVEKIDDMNYLIYDILVYPQICSAAKVDTDDEAYTKWLHSQPDEIFNKIRYQGHSHVKMGVTPSPIDEKYYADVLKNLKPNDFYIFGVYNKNGNETLRLYAGPEKYTTTDLLIGTAIKKENIYTYAEKMMKEYVKTRTYPKEGGIKL